MSDPELTEPARKAIEAADAQIRIAMQMLDNPAGLARYGYTVENAIRPILDAGHRGLAEVLHGAEDGL